MEGFTADDAREIVNTMNNREFSIILVKIREQAESGKSVLHIYHELDSRTVSGLKERGFEVISKGGYIQRDDLFYSIYWD